MYIFNVMRKMIYEIFHLKREIESGNVVYLGTLPYRRPRQKSDQFMLESIILMYFSTLGKFRGKTLNLVYTENSHRKDWGEDSKGRETRESTGQVRWRRCCS